DADVAPVGNLRGTADEFENHPRARIDSRAGRKPDGQGRSLEEQRTEAAVARRGALRSRTTAPSHQELPSPSAAARSVATTGGGEEVGGVNQRSLPNFNYEWA